MMDVLIVKKTCYSLTTNTITVSINSNIINIIITIIIIFRNIMIKLNDVVGMFPRSWY